MIRLSPGGRTEGGYPYDRPWERSALLLPEGPSDGLASKAIRSHDPVAEQPEEGRLWQHGQKTAGLCILDDASSAVWPSHNPRHLRHHDIGNEQIRSL